MLGTMPVWNPVLHSMVAPIKCNIENAINTPELIPTREVNSCSSQALSCAAIMSFVGRLLS